MPDFRGTATRVFYTTIDGNGDPATSTGVVIVPDGAAPRGGWPVVASDYAGHGTQGETFYVDGRSQAYNTADLLRVARQLPQSGKVSNRYVVIGHSQGGQTAVFAAAVNAEYAPELRLVGTIALSPAVGWTTGAPRIQDRRHSVVDGSHPLAKLESQYVPGFLDKLLAGFEAIDFTRCFRASGSRERAGDRWFVIARGDWFWRSRCAESRHASVRARRVAGERSEQSRRMEYSGSSSSQQRGLPRRAPRHCSAKLAVRRGTSFVRRGHLHADGVPLHWHARLPVVRALDAQAWSESASGCGPSH